MTTHARTKLRRAVAEMVTDLATTQGNVFPSRRGTLDEDQLPAITIYTTSETVSAVTLSSPPLLRRQVDLIIEVNAMIDEHVDDVLDTACAEIEVAMSEAIIVEGVTVPAALVDTTVELFDEGADQIGSARMTYRATYGTLENAPETLI